MSGTSCVEPAVRIFTSVETLPAGVLALLQGGDLFGTLPWWQVVLAHAMPAHAQALFAAVESRGRPLLIVPMLRLGRRLTSLTTPYSCVYLPRFAEGMDRDSRIAAVAAFARYCRSSGVVRLDALPAESAHIDELATGSRQGGLFPLRFDHFGNWSENVAGVTWPAYLAGRPGALRETIRRRLRRAEQLADARFQLLTRPEQAAQAAELFEAVYRRSWKPAEPYPDFNAALIRAMAAHGWLRLGIWSVGTRPVAVQFWVVRERQAIVLKLAHDEEFRSHAPGTVLTAFMLRHLLDAEQVERIDFGRGDDLYKQGWAHERRQRVGLLLVNPLRPEGVAALAQHAAGRVRGFLRAALS